MISVDVYLKRRGVDSLKTWIKTNKITDYKHLRHVLLVRGIRPPLEKDVEVYFKPPAPVPKSKKTTPKRRRRRKQDFSKVDVVKVKRSYTRKKTLAPLSGSAI